MRPIVLRIVYHVRLGVRDETKSTGSFSFRIFHDDDIHNFSPFLKMGFQRFIGGSIVQTSNENLTVHLGLILKVGCGVNKMADIDTATHHQNEAECVNKVIEHNETY